MMFLTSHIKIPHFILNLILQKKKNSSPNVIFPPCLAKNLIPRNYNSKFVPCLKKCNCSSTNMTDSSFQHHQSKNSFQLSTFRAICIPGEWYIFWELLKFVSIMFSATSDCDSVFIPQEMPSLIWLLFPSRRGDLIWEGTTVVTN